MLKLPIFSKVHVNNYICHICTVFREALILHPASAIAVLSVALNPFDSTAYITGCLALFRIVIDLYLATVNLGRGERHDALLRSTALSPEGTAITLFCVHVGLHLALIVDGVAVLGALSCRTGRNLQILLGILKLSQEGITRASGHICGNQLITLLQAQLTQVLRVVSTISYDFPVVVFGNRRRYVREQYHIFSEHVNVCFGSWMESTVDNKAPSLVDGLYSVEDIPMDHHIPFLAECAGQGQKGSGCSKVSKSRPRP